MTKRFWLIAVVASLAAGIAYAQYPILDMVADKVVQKYQSSSCEQLWQKKGEPKSPEEQRIIGLLQTTRRCAPRSSTRSQRRSRTRCSNAE